MQVGFIKCHCLLEIHLCSWTLVLLPSCFFWWQVWLWVVGRRMDVYWDEINQSRWALCFLVGFFTGLVISEAGHQASPDYRVPRCSYTANPLSRLFIEVTFNTDLTISKSRALFLFFYYYYYFTWVQQGSSSLVCGVQANETLTVRKDWCNFWIKQTHKQCWMSSLNTQRGPGDFSRRR